MNGEQYKALIDLRVKLFMGFGNIGQRAALRKAITIIEQLDDELEGIKTKVALEGRPHA